MDKGNAVTDALFGMFLQDIRDIEKRNPRYFANTYYRYEYTAGGPNRYELVIQPASLPEAIDREVRLSFESRLNRDGKKWVRKTLLVATDLSDAAGNAARYAAEMAADLNGRLVLFNAYPEIAPGMIDPVALVRPRQLQSAIEQRLAAEAGRVAGDQGVPVDIMSKGGAVVEAILEAGLELKADLIVAGMRGGGHAFRRLLGSTVSLLAERTTIPLLIIPESVSYHRPREIGLACDPAPGSDIRLPDSVPGIVEMAHPGYSVVRISERNALAGFLSTHPIDMLAVVLRRRSLRERLFQPGLSKKIILRSRIPLLVLPEGRSSSGGDRL